MDLRKLKTILDLFENSGIQELEITEGEEKLRLVKGKDGEPVADAVEQATQQVEAPKTVEESPEAVAAPVVKHEEGGTELVDIVAPMVGTYYSRPGADEPPFVKKGDHVNEGDVVCIIEAMKLFNNVTATASGTIERMMVENEQPVGYGDVLMVIKPEQV